MLVLHALKLYLKMQWWERGRERERVNAHIVTIERKFDFFHLFIQYWRDTFLFQLFRNTQQQLFNYAIIFLMTFEIFDKWNAHTIAYAHVYLWSTECRLPADAIASDATTATTVSLAGVRVWFFDNDGNVENVNLTMYRRVWFWSSSTLQQFSIYGFHSTPMICIYQCILFSFEIVRCLIDHAQNSIYAQLCMHKTTHAFHALEPWD